MMYVYISLFFLKKAFSISEDVKNGYEATPDNFQSKSKYNSLEYYLMNLHQTQSLLVDANSPKTNSEVTDGSRVAPQNGEPKINKTFIHEFITNSSNRDMNYTIDTRSYSYQTIYELFMFAFGVLKNKENCNLNDFNKTTLEATAIIFINYIGLNNKTSINDTISFFKLFSDIYNKIKPCNFDGKIYQTSAECNYLTINEKVVNEYFEKNTGLITFEYLVKKVKCMCPKVEEFMKFHISYLNMTNQKELLDLIEKTKKRISDKNDAIHKSSNPISDFCNEIISNSKIANFIINNVLAIDYILCNIRNMFNVTDITNKDYLNGVDILNSLINPTTKTTSITDSTSSAKSGKLSSVAIGLITAAVIVVVLILVVVSIFMYKKYRK